MTKQAIKRILLTGFEAFDNEAINPTQKLVLEYNEATTGLRIDKLILPVSYQRAWETVFTHLKVNPIYDYVIHFGQAGGRGDISLELGAWNLDMARISDCDGDRPQERLIDTDNAPLFLPATLPLWDLRESLKKAEIPASFSKDPGGYVCNNLLYKSLRHAAKADLATKIGFIHVPYLVSQALNHPGAPSVTFAHLQNMLRTILASLAVDK